MSTAFSDQIFKYITYLTVYSHILKKEREWMQISNEIVNLNAERTVTIVGVECGVSNFQWLCQTLSTRSTEC